jgi:hypothetical protein
MGLFAMLGFRHHFAIIHAAALCAALIAGAAVAAAQNAANSPVQLAPADAAAPAPQPAPAPAPAPSGQRIPTPQETFSAIGRFIDKSITDVGATVKGAGETIGGATSAAGDLAKGVGDVAGTVVRMPTNVVTGRERCQMLSNGSSDCTAAGAALCKQKGFADGKSLEVTSAQNCPATVWLKGGNANAAECKAESFVAKAVCQ